MMRMPTKRAEIMLYCPVVLGYTLASCAWKTKMETICGDHRGRL